MLETFTAKTASQSFAARKRTSITAGRREFLEARLGKLQQAIDSSLLRYDNLIELIEDPRGPFSREFSRKVASRL